MSDVRFAGEWLPMFATENTDSMAAEYLTRSQHVQLGCESKACGRLAKTCLHGLLCVDLWRYAECRSVSPAINSIHAGAKKLAPLATMCQNGGTVYFTRWCSNMVEVCWNRIRNTDDVVQRCIAEWRV